MDKPDNRPPLLLFTDEFPFAQGEPFLENELPYLLSAFRLTLVSTANKTETLRPCGDARVLHEPMGFRLFGLPSYLLSALRFVFSRSGRTEIGEILASNTPAKARQLLSSLSFWVNSEDFYHRMKKQGLFAGNTPSLCYFYWNNYKVLALARRRKSHPHLRFLVRMHGYDLYNERTPHGRQPFKRQVDALMHSVVFVSEAGMRYYHRTFSIPMDARHHISRLGTVNEGALVPHVPHDTKLLLSCSNVVPLKRLPLLIESLALLDDLPLVWHHFGGGPELEAVQAYAQKLLEPRPNIRFVFHGVCPNAQVLSFYRSEAVDAFVTLTKTEGGCPVSISEALSFGMPVVATAVGGIPEMLEGSGNCLLPEDPTAKAVAEALRTMLTLPEREELRRECRRIWQERFMAQKVYADFVRLLQKTGG